jgi:hypothetical protein
MFASRQKKFLHDKKQTNVLIQLIQFMPSLSFPPKPTFSSNTLHSKRFHAHIFANPIKHRPMPHQTILRLQHKMVLIGKSQKSTLDPPRLQNVESGQPL